jgi:hypothetical protein
MLAFTVIAALIIIACIATGGWWGWLGASFTRVVVAGAVCGGIRELRRRRCA